MIIRRIRRIRVALFLTAIWEQLVVGKLMSTATGRFPLTLNVATGPPLWMIEARPSWSVGTKHTTDECVTIESS